MHYLILAEKYLEKGKVNQKKKKRKKEKRTGWKTGNIVQCFSRFYVLAKLTM